MLAEKIDAAGFPPAIPPYVLAGEDPPSERLNLAGPFPNLRCKETVKEIVEAVVETTNFCKLTDTEAYHFALGIVRGARIVAALDDNTTLERYVVDLLARLNAGGVAAIRELIAVVTGQELACALQ